MNRTKLSRRELLKSAAFAAAAPVIVPATSLGLDGATPPSQRVTMGFIGCGRQVHYHNIPLFVRTPGVQTLALCDVDSWRLNNAVQRVKEQYESGKAKGSYAPAATYVDYQELLARDDIDAVMISTPDHWHAKMALDAMASGKDVALEKPITRTVREGQQLIEAAKRYQRVFRVDSEFRSGAPAHRATSVVRNGLIGQVRRVTTCVPQSDIPSPPQPEMPVPPELDYQRWQGPAPRAPYTVRRVHPPKSYGRPGWMRHLYYCDGMITNWGTHLNNGAMWATDTERTGPVRIEGHGQYPEPDSFWNVLLSFDIQYRFADGLQWNYRTESPYLVIEGDQGWVKADFSSFQAEPKSLETVDLEKLGHQFRHKSEKQDFIDCVRSREETLEPAEVGHRVTSLGLLGHISINLGEELVWDPVTERFLGNDAANALLDTPIREPRRNA
jgi:predicted dehydrogenase